MKKITLSIAFILSALSIQSQVDLKVDNGGELYISKSAYIYISNNGNLNIDTNGTIIMDSDSNEFSNLYVDGTSNGEAEYRRWTSSASTRDLISAPVYGEAFNNFYQRNSTTIALGTQGGDLLFGYYDNNNTDGNYYESSATDTYFLSSGIGYRAATISGATLSFIGSVNTADTSVSINSGTGQYSFANLIGNPYTTSIKATDLITELENSNALNTNFTAIYAYDGDITGDDGSTWRVINNLNSTNVTIAPGQAFMVYSDDDNIAENITFSESMRTVNTSDDFLVGRTSNNSPDIHSQFMLKISNSTNTAQFNGTHFYFLNTFGTRGLDIGWDAGANDLPELSISSILANSIDNTPFQIQCLSSSDIIAVSSDLIVPLHVKAIAGNTYSITIENSTIPNSSDIFLHDTLLNTSTLLTQNSYEFTANTNLNGVGRFYLRTTDETLGNQEYTFSDLSITSISKPHKQLLIKGLINNNTTVNLYDMTGRKVNTFSIEPNGSNSYAFDISNISTGVYLATLINSADKNQTLSKKIIVK